MTGARLATWIQERGWVLNLVFIALGSYFVAGAANALVARRIRVIPTTQDAATPPLLMGHPMGGGSGVEFTSMAARNLLGLKREDLNPVAETTADTLPGHFDENNLRPCTLTSTLRATLVSNNPAWSMAVLINNSTRDPQAYSTNRGSNMIADDATLVEIRSREVIVRRRDHYERCLGEGEGSAPVSGMGINVAPTPVASSGDEPPGPTPGDMTGVTKISDTQYNIERGEVDKALSNLSEVSTQARMVPSFKNGKTNGFKLFSIKPGSIFSKIGMQNGDVIQKINGYEINSPEKALEMYQKLREAQSVQIDLQRRGQNMNMNYNITQ